MDGQSISNFGQNVEFTPVEFLRPKDELELLTQLATVDDRRIRAIGRLHSWSQAPVGTDVVIDLRELNQVTVERRDDGSWVTVGAGCQIKRLLAELEPHGLTTPSVGLITEQTIAGAMSTGTHGSGKHSLSHYAAEIRLATFDAETGQPTIRVVSNGPELRAARCSLGSMGVIVSVSFWARPQYNVEEHFRSYNTLADVLAAEADFPLQQFYLIPWSWNFLVQHRREVDRPRSRLAAIYRWYFFGILDIGLHLSICLLARFFRPRWATKFFFRHVAQKTVIRRWRVVDRSHEMLVMEHELFRHIEIEVFVTASVLQPAIDFVCQLLRFLDGDANAFSDETRERLAAEGLNETVDQLRGTYTHRYVVCVRRVLTDDTMISMASDWDAPAVVVEQSAPGEGLSEASLSPERTRSADVDGWCYALSFISYESPGRRQAFHAFAEVLHQTMARLFAARPHWGKVCPIDARQARQLYPQLDEFQDQCRAADPKARFRNDWIEDVLFRE